MASEEPISPKVDESLAAQMGDPAGSPQAIEAKDPVLGAIATMGITAVVAGGLLALFVDVAPCMGATRSAKVKWEKRQQEVMQAEAAHERLPHE